MLQPYAQFSPLVLEFATAPPDKWIGIAYDPQTSLDAEKDGKRVFRYMKAIPTGALCLNCHGTTLAPEVAAKLHELYPADAATGFNAGDLRGAFTITETP